MNGDKDTRWVKCPACGELVEAVSYFGVIKGWCAVARKYVHINLITN